ncbi:MAG: carboxypeptidase-like regulatory domain-containing protein [Acidobacteriota bacterium]|nr:carboxypeptidase-like regulatory domain-containing protein [Acidobacteriota bacterium]
MKLKLGSALITMLVLSFSTATGVSAQTGTIKGKVKEEGGKAMEGVLVQAINVRNKEDKQQVNSDSKGDFEFSGLPAGDYSFSFEKQGYKTFLTRKLAVIGGETLRLTAELKREGEPFSLIRGAVLNSIGYSMPNASVLLERIDGGRKFKQEKASGEGGQFVFRLKAEKAKYRITANARGFQSASTEIEIESDEVRNIALTLQPVK